MINWELSLIVRLPFGHLFTALIASLSASFRSRAALQLEILALRHQIGVLQRSVKRPKLTPADRLLWAWLCTVWKDWKSGVFIMKASTVVGWHRKGFRLFWTWKIRRGKPGRPTVPKEVRELIRTMSRDNPLWGAPRIHGELLKLGIEIGETSVGKYMVRRRRPPSQTWRTFLENHVKSMVSVDFFAVPTIRFQILYVFLVLAHERRRIVHFAVTAHPTAEWTAQQLREAFPLGYRATLSAAGSRSDLREGLRRPGEGNGHQTSAFGTAVALAACVRGTGDRHYSPRVPGSHDRLQSNGACTGTSKASSTTIIGAARIWHWRRTARSRDRSNRRRRGGSSRSRRWAGCIIVTSAAPPDRCGRPNVGKLGRHRAMRSDAVFPPENAWDPITAGRCSARNRNLRRNDAEQSSDAPLAVKPCVRHACYRH